MKRYEYKYKTRIIKKYQIIEVCLDTLNGTVTEVVYDEIIDKIKAIEEIRELNIKESNKRRAYGKFIDEIKSKDLNNK